MEGAAAEAEAAEAAAAEAAAAAAGEEEAAAAAEQARFEEMMASLIASVGNVVIQSRAHLSPTNGALVCKSIYDNVNRGDGWDQNDFFTSESGCRWHKKQALPHEERFRCWRCNGFGHMRAACPY